MIGLVSTPKKGGIAINFYLKCFQEPAKEISALENLLFLKKSPPGIWKKRRIVVPFALVNYDWIKIPKAKVSEKREKSSKWPEDSKTTQTPYEESKKKGF